MTQTDIERVRAHLLLAGVRTVDICEKFKCGRSAVSGVITGSSVSQLMHEYIAEKRIDQFRSRVGFGEQLGVVSEEAVTSPHFQEALMRGVRRTRGRTHVAGFYAKGPRPSRARSNIASTDRL